VTGAPKLEITGDTTLDLGTYRAREKRSLRVTLQNTGDEELVLRRARKTCGCFRIPEHKTRLSPGETGSFTIEVIPDSVYHSFRKYVFLESNDPEQKTVRFTIKGNAVPLVGITPHPKCGLGILQPDMKWERVFVLEPNEEDTVLGAPQVEGSQPVEARLDLRHDAPNQWFLTVTGKAVEGSSRFTCKVTIPVEKPEGCKDLVVVLSGKVGAAE